MKKFKIVLATALLAVASALAVRPAGAETFKKLHSSILTIINAAAGEFNDTNEPTSTTVDLSGGDTDKCSFAVYASSAAGTTTMSLAVQVSPDGGTSWVPTSTTITVATSTTLGAAVTAHSANVNVSPGSKLRVVPTLASSCTYYHLKLYAMPSAD